MIGHWPSNMLWWSCLLAASEILHSYNYFQLCAVSADCWFTWGFFWFTFCLLVIKLVDRNYVYMHFFSYLSILDQLINFLQILFNYILLWAADGFDLLFRCLIWLPHMLQSTLLSHWEGRQHCHPLIGGQFTTLEQLTVLCLLQIIFTYFWRMISKLYESLVS